MQRSGAVGAGLLDQIRALTAGQEDGAAGDTMFHLAESFRLRGRWEAARETYELFLLTHGVDPKGAAMFEDLARNLAAPKALGMTTVLIVPRNFEPTFAEIWESDPLNDDDVDFVTDDLGAFLGTLVEKSA